MKHFYTLLLGLFLAASAFSQSVFAPAGSYFTYNYTNYFSNGSQTLQYVNDTMINGHNVKALCKAGYYTVCVCPTPPVYYSICDYWLLEQNDSLYQYFTYDSLQLLYTFDTNVGDSIIFNRNDPPHSYWHKLDSTGIINFCGQNRDVLYYSVHDADSTCLSTVPYTVVRGIGPIDNYLIPQHACNDGTGLYLFDCVSTGSCTYPSATCNYKPFSLQQHYVINTFVSNSGDQISIRFSKPVSGTLIVYDILGSIIYETRLENQDSFEYGTSDLAGGLYSFCIQGTGTVVRTGKFVAE